MNKILIVEDEKHMLQGLKDNLEFEGYEVDTAEEGKTGLEKIKNNKYNLVLLDVMLPEISGFDVCKTARKEGIQTPIILLTAKGEEIDKVLGLELGADDYITKPFSPGELEARIKALLRRSSLDQSVIEIDGLRLNPETRDVTSGDIALELSPAEFNLLHFLMARPERVFSRAQLLDRVWGEGKYVEDRTVDVHIRRLRAALEPAGHAELIQTVRGVGYKLSGKG
jgi:phosphate regulon transcriptional regulator PhoB